MPDTLLIEFQTVINTHVAAFAGAAPDDKHAVNELARRVCIYQWSSLTPDQRDQFRQYARRLLEKSRR